MKEYIEREAALQALCEAVHAKDGSIPCRNQLVSCLWDGTRTQEYAEKILSIPAADVVPVRHAIWRYKTMTVPGGRGQTYAKWSCTACKVKQKERSNYCPNCGALMDKDGDGHG